MKKSLCYIMLALTAAGCSHKTTAVTETGGVVSGYTGASTGAADQQTSKPVLRQQNPEGMLPNATAFRMNGNYADNVAITVNSNGEVTYFPAPSDITAASRPTDLGNGWWLNNQGISQNSVFTTFTFEEYSKLASAPSIEQLKAAVIPGSEVTAMIELPCKVGQADSQISIIKEFLENK